MTPQSFVTLAGVTVAAVALAVISSNTSGIGNAIADRGDRLFPNLAGAANTVARLEVDLGDTKTIITRDGDTFIDTTGYPVNAGTVRELAANLASMQIEEKKTADKARHKDLRLADPDVVNGGERLTLKTASGGTIADVILGERDLTVGGTRGGQFVRKAGEDQTYLVRGSISVPLSRSGWFETQLQQIAAADITGVTLTSGDKTIWSIKRAGSVLVPENLNDGDKPDTSKIGTVTRIVGPLRFTDVRKSTETNAPPDAAKTLTFSAKNGLTLKLTAIKATDNKDGDTSAEAKPKTSGEGDDTRWVRIAVGSSAAESAEAAKALEKKVSGFDFRISSTDYEKFGWTLADLKSEPQS
jgi:predicted Rdx family selenoprotein